MADMIAGKPQTVTVDGKDYVVDQLNENARNQIANLQVVDQEIVRLQQQLVIARTARAVYANVLKTELKQQH